MLPFSGAKKVVEDSKEQVPDAQDNEVQEPEEQLQITEKTAVQVDDVQLVEVKDEREEALTTLKDFQRQLKELIKSGKLFARAAKDASGGTVDVRRQAKEQGRELLTKIAEIQEKYLVAGTGGKRAPATQSLQYLTCLAVDLAKLLNAAYAASTLPKDKLKQLVATVASADQSTSSLSDESPVVAVANKLFRHFVAFETGPTRSHVLTVIKDRLWPLMDSKERVAFFSTIVLEFLSRPAGGYSQKSIVEALGTFTIPAGDLIWFLSQRLGLQGDSDALGRAKSDKTAPEQPLVMVSSILILSLQQIQRVESEAAEEGLAGRWTLLGVSSRAEAAKSAKKAQEGLLNNKKNEESGKNGEEGSAGTESDDMIEDLEPLGVQRSYSVPTSGPKGGTRQGAGVRLQPAQASDGAAEGRGLEVGRLNEDEQLLAVFKLAVWICRRPTKELSRPEKAVLLLHAVNNLNGLQKSIRSVSTLASVVQMGQSDLLELCVAVLCFEDAKLLQGLETLLSGIAQPAVLTQLARYITDLQGDKAGSEPAARRKLTEATEHDKAERAKHLELLKSWTSQMQGLLIWLVERQSKGTTSELPPVAARAVYSSSPWVAQLGEKCLASTQIWIEHLSYLLKSYIRYSRALMGLESQAAEASASPALASLDVPKNQGGGAKDEEDLVPLKMAKSLSLPIARQPHQGVRLSPAETSIQLIKSFMALLLEPDQAKPA